MKYLLLGMGISNKSIERYFQSQNISYCVYDDVTCPNEIKLDEIDIVIKSPGVNNDHFIIKGAKKVITDLEFFYLLSRKKTLITVTGSNGKTTTVSLLNHLLDNIDLGGNVGVPLFDFIDSDKDIIIEASSFMLEYTHTYRSKYNIILNIFKTHLEHHHTYVNYIKSKLKLLKNTLNDDYIIYNYDDVLLRRIIPNYQGIKVPFSRTRKVGIYLDNDKIKYDGKVLVDTKSINLIGDHNYSNVMAALGVIINYRGDIKSLAVFNGVKYRLEYIGSINNVKVYNDSKSTNFHALYNAVNTFKGKRVVLICGGQKRDDDYKLFTNIDNIIRLYCYGDNRYDLSQYFNNININCYETLDDVFKNLDLSNCEVLLFSPGSVSYDQFESYIKRGEEFERLVNKYLKEENTN